MTVAASGIAGTCAPWTGALLQSCRVVGIGILGLIPFMGSIHVGRVVQAAIIGGPSGRQKSAGHGGRGEQDRLGGLSKALAGGTILALATGIGMAAAWPEVLAGGGHPHVGVIFGIESLIPGSGLIQISVNELRLR